MLITLKALFFASILVLSITLTPLTFAQNGASYVSPLKQFQSGVALKDIVCGNNLQLFVKKDGLPVCLKPQTAKKLVERGWEIIAKSPPPMPTSCPAGQIIVNGQCVTSIPTINAIKPCNGDTLVPYSYASPCVRPTPTCPSGMTFSKGVCTAWGYTPPSPPPQPQCDPNTGVCSGIGYAVVSCSGASSSAVICEPGSLPCPTGLQGDLFGTSCNYSPPKCSTGFSAIQISAGSYSCQPTNPPPLSDATTFPAGQKVGAFTISKINQYNVTGYYNSPYPIERPGLGEFTIMHVGDTLNPTCDGQAPLVITAINYPNSITVSIGKSTEPRYACPVCLAANSEIRTPNGDVNVKDIKDGMTVWSTDSNGIMIQSKVVKINNVFVGDAHKVIDLQLSDGRELFASPNHPTYDGRIIADLKVGEAYDGSTVKSIELVPYKYQFTYDILPDSLTGNYFANGILVGSTLK